MRARQPRRPPPPLDAAMLKELGLRYVARFATSRGKLTDYLRRKLRERGWEGSGDPPVAAIVDWAANAGFIDDRAYALSKARTMGARGLGERRLTMALREAGIEDDDGAPARDHARDTADEAALKFARRKRIGPYAVKTPDRQESAKALAAMMRAGHPFELSKRILSLPADFDTDA